MDAFENGWNNETGAQAAESIVQAGPGDPGQDGAQAQAQAPETAAQATEQAAGAEGQAAGDAGQPTVAVERAEGAAGQAAEAAGQAAGAVEQAAGQAAEAVGQAAEAAGQAAEAAGQAVEGAAHGAAGAPWQRQAQAAQPAQGWQQPQFGQPSWGQGMGQPAQGWQPAAQPGWQQQAQPQGAGAWQQAQPQGGQGAWQPAQPQGGQGAWQQAQGWQPAAQPAWQPQGGQGAWQQAQGWRPAQPGWQQQGPRPFAQAGWQQPQPQGQAPQAAQGWQQPQSGQAAWGQAQPAGDDAAAAAGEAEPAEAEAAAAGTEFVLVGPGSSQAAGDGASGAARGGSVPASVAVLGMPAQGAAAEAGAYAAGPEGAGEAIPEGAQQTIAHGVITETVKRPKKRKAARVLAGVLAAALVMASVFGVGVLTGGNGLVSISKNGIQFGQAQASAGGEAVTAQDGEPAAAQAGEPAATQEEAGGAAAADAAAGQRGNHRQQQPTTEAGQPADGAADGAAEGAAAEPAEQAGQAEADAQAEAAAGAQALEGDVTPLALNSPTGKDLTVAEIYKKVAPSIVGIRITFPQRTYSYFYFGGGMEDEEASGEGSGIIIKESGYIMTNYHVISEVLSSRTGKQADGSKIEVFLPSEPETPYQASIVGKDSDTDLAVLKIEKTGLPAAELGDADQLVIGEMAVAIGNPGGMEYMSSITQGIISGLNRTIQTEGYKDIKLIQTDAAINPGNSGGALINSKGQVIGVNSIKISADAYEGLGFAIPINTAAEICQDLMSYTYVKGRPYIGVSINSFYTEQYAEQRGMPTGVYVENVSAGSPAEAAGILANDIITKFDGKAIANYDDLDAAKKLHKPGDVVTIEVYRNWSQRILTDGTNVQITLTLGETNSGS